MIIEALVKIELKSNGTWKIVQFGNTFNVSDTLLPEEQPHPGVVTKKGGVRIEDDVPSYQPLYRGRSRQHDL